MVKCNKKFVSLLFVLCNLILTSEYYINELLLASEEAISTSKHVMFYEEEGGFLHPFVTFKDSENFFQCTFVYSKMKTDFSGLFVNLLKIEKDHTIIDIHDSKNSIRTLQFAPIITSLLKVDSIPSKFTMCFMVHESYWFTFHMMKQYAVFVVLDPFSLVFTADGPKFLLKEIELLTSTTRNNICQHLTDLAITYKEIARKIFDIEVFPDQLNTLYNLIDRYTYFIISEVYYVCNGNISKSKPPTFDLFAKVRFFYDMVPRKVSLNSLIIEAAKINNDVKILASNDNFRIIISNITSLKPPININGVFYTSHSSKNVPLKYIIRVIFRYILNIRSIQVDKIHGGTRYKIYSSGETSLVFDYKRSIFVEYYTLELINLGILETGEIK